MILKRAVVLLALLCAFCQPFTATLLPPSYLDCVVALGRHEVNPVTKQVVFIPEASGFFYGWFVSRVNEQANNYRLFLVTNRHVVEEHARHSTLPLAVKVNLKTPGAAREYDIDVAPPKPNWYFHPNPAIDLAVLSTSGPDLQAQGVKFEHFRSDIDVLERKRAAELGLSEGDGAFVLGFPMGIVGAGQDYAIARQATIARIRDFLDSTVNSFLIDSFIFPGNSGGPVVLRPEMVSLAGKAAINQAYLIGVVKDYVAYQDIAVSQQTNRPRVTFEENSGLSSVVPIEYVRETIEAYLKAESPK